MFTGIVRELGKVISITPHHRGALLKIESPLALQKSSIGSSIAVNGVCLTVTQILGNAWTADVVTETMNKTTMGTLAQGDSVNIETPLAFGGTIDGHFVQGHVDGVGSVTSVTPLPDGSVEVQFSGHSDILKYVATKGSIAIDGISLTVVNADDRTFSIAMIPHTGKHTTLGLKSVGDLVNLEVDILAKYVEKVNITHNKEDRQK